MDADWYSFLNEVVQYSDAIFSPIGEFPPPNLNLDICIPAFREFIWRSDITSSTVL